MEPHLKKSGKRDSDPRPQPWQGCALPTELFPHLFTFSATKVNLVFNVKRRRLELPRHNWHYPLKVARLPIPPPLQISLLYTSNLVTVCPEQDSNLHALRHTHLKRARLPIPPPGLVFIFLERIYLLSGVPIFQRIERKTGLGPATPTLARLCSTNWAISALSKSLRNLF